MTKTLYKDTLNHIYELTVDTCKARMSVQEYDYPTAISELEDMRDGLSITLSQLRELHSVDYRPSVEDDND